MIVGRLGSALLTGELSRHGLSRFKGVGDLHRRPNPQLLACAACIDLARCCLSWDKTRQTSASMWITALSFLSITSIPKLRWSSPKAFTLKPPIVSVVFLIIGLVVFGLGEALLVTAGVGVSPWTVFAEGVTIVTGWSLGVATFIISASVLLLWIPLRQTPGIGTILNAIIIALMLQYVLPFLPTFETFIANALLALIGVFVTGFGGAIYLVANLGPGPRDGLMTGLQTITHQPIALVRTFLEILVVAIGWTLGGTLGLGTIFFALGIGPAIAIGMQILQFRSTVD
jgi:uncharacterized membrane protein YczE